MLSYYGGSVQDSLRRIEVEKLKADMISKLNMFFTHCVHHYKFSSPLACFACDRTECEQQKETGVQIVPRHVQRLRRKATFKSSL